MVSAEKSLPDIKRDKCSEEFLFGDAMQIKLFARGLLAGMALLSYGVTSAKDNGTTRYQTLPGSTIRDYSAPSYVTKGNVTYQTLPGSSVRDYRAPSYVTKGNTTYRTFGTIGHQHTFSHKEMRFVTSPLRLPSKLSLS